MICTSQRSTSRRRRRSVSPKSHKDSCQTIAKSLPPSCTWERIQYGTKYSIKVVSPRPPTCSECRYPYYCTEPTAIFFLVSPHANFWRQLLYLPWHRVSLVASIKQPETEAESSAFLEESFFLFAKLRPEEIKLQIPKRLQRAIYIYISMNVWCLLVIPTNELRTELKRRLHHGRF